MPQTAIFRCDASAAIGGGHVVRCFTLAEELQRRGWTCRLVSLPGTLAIVEPFAPRDVELVEHEQASDPRTLQALSPQGCDLLVVDNYALGSEFEGALEGWASRRMVIDDIPNRQHQTDIVLDQTLGRTQTSYDDLVGSGTLRLLGTGFALVRPAFARARRAALPRRESGHELARILVGLGATPQPEVVDLVLAGIAEADLAVEVHVLAGTGPIASLVYDGGPLVVHEATDTVHRLMADCDLAIGAGGGSAWERCSVGLPSLLLRVADNQNHVVDALSGAGAAIDLGLAADVSSAKVAAELRSLVRHPARRAELARNAARACDGLGVRRVAGMIAPRRARDGQPVTLRPATAADVRLTFAWQQVPEIRHHSPNAQPQTWTEHTAWFTKRTEDPSGGPFSIIEYGRRPVGVLRLDETSAVGLDVPSDSQQEGGSFVVSVFVDPEFHRIGIAGAVLNAGRDLLPDARFYARVMPDNAASHRLFQTVGYRPALPGLYVSGPNLA
ncbi:MAG TPA: UDP-2,4-diacetamido-2,4,6-trideoxy-beta-L-altropyranose hydrolase [Gemmatimonadetes bacterium]|nr:UDP-2,4-diacetamido-2,4,6-trideoxy-beta-L-altropyranose hydrolase [Gemmatimonadota bacterium]